MRMVGGVGWEMKYMKPTAFLKESWRSEEEKRVAAKVSTSTSRIVPLAARWRRKRAVQIEMW
jgi:hypothetical protein